MKRLAIVTTHPIQYNAPIFALLAERGKIAIRIFYTWSQAEKAVYDPGFRRQREWDIPLLKGYDYQFIENTATRPGSHWFYGIKNPGLVNEIKLWKPDAVLVFGWSFQSHLKCLRYFKGKLPVFFRGDSTLLDEKSGVKTLLRRLFLYWVYRHVDKVFFVGTQNKRYFSKYGVKDQQMVSAFHAIDNVRFANPDPKSADALRLSLGFKPDDFVILFAGKLEPKKNPFFMIRLAEKLTGSHYRFLIVGDGDLEKELKKAANQDGRIHFLGFQNQSFMPSVYAASNCFLLPSTGPGETWGLAANEAMAAGLPVLLSEKVGGAIDLVRDNGIIFQLQDVEGVTRYITKLSGDTVQYQKARNASLEQVKKFQLADFAEALENALLEKKP